MAYDRRAVLASITAGATVPLAGCGGSELQTETEIRRDELEAEHDAVVQMTDGNDFVPETVTIPVGGSVVWFNSGESEHTVTAYENRIPDDAEYFDSGEHESEARAREDNGTGVLRGGDTYSYTFEVPGEYEYFCIPHEEYSNMVGTVIVEEQATATDDTS